MRLTGSDKSTATSGKGFNWLLPTVTGLILAMTLFTAGCSHPLTVKNIAQYQPLNITTLDRPMTIGIVSNQSNPADLKLLNGIAMSLGSYAARVIMPYSKGKNDQADVVATIAIQSRYDGSDTNFWINFPGFLVWAPAWNGYIYEIFHNVDVRLANGSGQQFESFTIPIKLDVRHADINRTWTEASWLEFGVIALVGGICFTSYDESVTPLLADAIQQPVGNYISQEIIKRINANLNASRVSSALPAL